MVCLRFIAAVSGIISVFGDSVSRYISRSFLYKCTVVALPNSFKWLQEYEELFILFSLLQGHFNKKSPAAGEVLPNLKAIILTSLYKTLERTFRWEFQPLNPYRSQFKLITRG